MEAVRYKENGSSQLFPKTEAVSCFRKTKSVKSQIKNLKT